jgi:DNA-binding PadR family transcriptional regulator
MTGKKKNPSRSSVCPCQGDTLEKFFHPTILAIVAAEKIHGYEIVKRLTEKPLQKGGKPDLAGVYRILHQMAEQGLIASSWECDGGKPAKRCYFLTAEGKECLSLWKETLAAFRSGISQLMREITVVLKKKPGDHPALKPCCTPPRGNRKRATKR